MAWLAIFVAIAAAALFGAWKYAMANNAVALLDWGDRQFGGNAGYAIALPDGHFGPDPMQAIEVVTPDQPSATPLPVLVFVHGGGWHDGKPRDYRFIGRRFARAGYVVVLAGYRLVPQGRYPAMLEDGAAALAWVNENVARFGGDPQRVFVMGHSAGAYNVVMLALERQWLGRAGVKDDFIKGVVGLSGPYDFYPFTSDSARNAFGQVADPAITQPINHVRSDAPPMLLLTGDADDTVKPRNTLVLAKALGLTPVVLPGVDHAGTIMKLAAPFDRDARVIQPVLQFLARHGGASAPVQARAR